jgi:hypothetical protein
VNNFTHTVTHKSHVNDHGVLFGGFGVLPSGAFQFATNTTNLGYKQYGDGRAAALWYALYTKQDSCRKLYYCGYSRHE